MLLARPRPYLVPCIAALLILAMAFHGPIAQLANYHHFADTRGLFGIPNAGDVLSNLGFLLVGSYGLLLWHRLPADTIGRPAYGVFCAALALTAAGSTWYHLAPDDARLVWDRLPIALGCGALLSLELQRAYRDVAWARASLALLLVTAVASVAWWTVSGDLRPYLLLQGAPLLLIPILQWQSGAPLARRTAFIVAIGLYVLAKMCEVADGALFQALGAVSGHTLKHLLATVAALVLLRQYRRQAP